MPTGRHLNAETRNLILRLSIAGWTTDQIMERTGLSRTTVLAYTPAVKKKATNAPKRTETA